MGLQMPQLTGNDDVEFREAVKTFFRANVGYVASRQRKERYQRKKIRVGVEKCCRGVEQCCPAQFEKVPGPEEMSSEDNVSSESDTVAQVKTATIRSMDGAVIGGNSCRVEEVEAADGADSDSDGAGVFTTMHDPLMVNLQAVHTGSAQQERSYCDLVALRNPIRRQSGFENDVEMLKSQPPAKVLNDFHGCGDDDNNAMMYW